METTTQSQKKQRILACRLPPELWVCIYQFVGCVRWFQTIYCLNREIHNYPWKTPLKNVDFRCDPSSSDYNISWCDFSYVTNLVVEKSDLFDQGIDDENLQYLQGIPNLVLVDCDRISDAGLAWLKKVLKV